ncbi:ribosomal protein L7Ae [Tritrichomonas foetus]|uniref:60S ribosomal protein L7a n=1 Tax=Tritrichomonas foetus TaxID=1144522 RepID=A0A1J4K2H6_9EUKA|nr:ribosomal protein L7Ae [Tritrichomonas foetus]|eukprot:OHT05000.1 ribosomal protein L7Ae [Tritrichomonas foetus]
MPARRAAAPEKVVLDQDIKKQEFLFAHETAQVAPDTTAKVQWPKYVRLQRQRRILMKRLKVPPPVNHFNHSLDKAAALQIFKFLERYRPETKKEKEARMKNAAQKSEQSLAPAEVASQKALVFGIKNVTSLIESKKARLVVIAHDVDPIEIVVWLPALCRKLDVPYCIVKSKARLGQIVGLNTTSCIALSEVRPEDRRQLQVLVDSVNANFLMRFKEEMHQWGGGELSEETIAKLRAQGKHD